MKSNYNDIIDIILTLIEDDDLASNIAVSGSIVPYIVLNKESSEYHSDLYILVKEKKMNFIRDKIKKLMREYDFNMTSDSNKISNKDYGFKMRYETTALGFFPYSIINNDLTIKTYSINNENKEIKLKKKVISNVNKSDVIRLTKFSSNKKLRIMSPEFILADKESREKEPGNPTDETMFLLNKISDDKTLDLVRKSVSSSKVSIITKTIKEDNKVLIVVLVILIIILLLIAYICFKK